MESRVAALHVAPERKAPMVAVGEIRAEAGRGIVGDRYFGTRHRHVSVQSQEELAEAAAARGGPVPAEDTRRNITLDHGRIPTTPGARLTIGDVELEVVRKAAPCRVMESSVGPGAARAMHERGGAICRVLSSGSIAVGDRAVTGAALIEA
ncbi:MOSC domain-containing protein [Actinomycetospora endophytica]|uniref:MOSC domain-containing protein n=1 Tax=Actinomycetospora endophytica TaxID=2291215 RepID=A0ABS8PCG0_9PSEU|nr:MOSC domain-containing protein [Actinomycetospora endophytica]MCD2195970.1 MOSC domain-containing protein [Actinomycetospora endophytica]